MRRFSAGEMEYISAGNIAWPHKTKGKIADPDRRYESCISIQTAPRRGAVHVCNGGKNTRVAPLTCNTEWKVTCQWFGLARDVKKAVGLLVSTRWVLNRSRGGRSARVVMEELLGDSRTAYFRQILVPKLLRLFIVHAINVHVLLLVNHIILGFKSFRLQCFLEKCVTAPDYTPSYNCVSV